MGRGDFRSTCRTVSKGIQEEGRWAAGAEVEESEGRNSLGVWESVPKGAGEGRGLQAEIGSPKMFSSMRKDAQVGVQR